MFRLRRTPEQIWDDGIGKPLDCDKVLRRPEEIVDIRRVDLYTKVPVLGCRRAPVTVRWVDI